MKFIKFENVDFKYNGAKQNALSNLTIDFEKSQFIAVLGRNGSGKSTMAKLMNALLLPTSGLVITNGYPTNEEDFWLDIRKSTGMVFQNPDNQIFSSTVDEEVAFGLENIGYEQEKIEQRVMEVLDLVGMKKYAKRDTSMLSGGQKQRITIAGVMAMKPKCIVLDEATAMLDPIGRKTILEVVKKLNREEGITIIHITHHMSEAILADRVIVIDQGDILLDDTPEKVFSNVEKIKSIGLDVPQVSELFHSLNSELDKYGKHLPTDVLDFDDAVSKVEALLK